MKKVLRSIVILTATVTAATAIAEAAPSASAQRKPASMVKNSPPGATAVAAPNAREQTLYGREKVVTDQERLDRATDAVAVASRETAIGNMRRLLRLKKGTKEEAGLIWRLADMEWRATKNYFRVSITSGAQDDSAKRLDSLMQNVVVHTTDILVRFPKFKDIREVLLRRGRAYEELKKPELALKDYLDYISKYPAEPQTVSVRLMASDVMLDFKQHSEILRILKPIDLAQSHGGLVRDVVERQAMANFNLENYPEALRKAEWLLSYDRRRGTNIDKGTPYDEAIAMVGLFYGTAFEKRLAGYSLEHALDYFRRLENATAFGRLSHEFILVMRSKEMQAEVIEWKDLCLAKLPQQFDTLGVMVDVYDAIINWKMYSKFSDIERDFNVYFGRNPQFAVRAQKEEAFAKFKRNLLDFADKIFATLPKKEPSVSDHKVIADPYLKALNAYMRIADPRDTMKGRVRFRIGEFYLGLRDWDRAQAAFTDVYQAKLFAVESKELRDQARLKAMAARYDSFKERGVIPKDMKAGPLSSPKKPLAADVAEWVKWVDEVVSEKAAERAALKAAPKSATAEVIAEIGRQNELMDTMLFEANRLVYVYSDIEAAYKRMLIYVGTRPNSKLTPPTCALIIDTLIQSEAWVATRTLAIKFQSMPNVAVGEFKQKLITLEQDAHYKITQNFYKTKDYEKAMAFAEEHLKLYPATKRKTDLYSMLGKSAMELKKSDVALSFMNEVIKLDPNHSSVGVAYFVRAQDHERAFRFKEAFEDFYRVYRLPSDKRGISDAELPTLRKKLFLMAITSDDASTLKKVAEGPDFCGAKDDGDLRIECDRLVGIRALNDDGDRRTAWELIEIADKAPKESRAVWYAAGLVKGTQLPNTVIRRVVEDLVKAMPNLDSGSQMEVLSSMNLTVPRLFDRKVETVESTSPVDKRINLLKDTLEKRIRETNGLETLAGSLVLLPSPEIRVKVLTRLAHAYRKIGDELKAVPIPKGFAPEEVETFQQAIASMLDPLDKKFNGLGAQVWEVAKAHGLASFWMDPAVEQQVGDLYIQPIVWNEKDAYLEALPKEERSNVWVKAIREGRAHSMIFYYQLSQTPSGDRLALSEGGKALLQFATLSALNMDSVLLDTAVEKEPKLSGEPLRLSLFSRLYRHVRSRSLEHIKTVKALIEMKRFGAESREEESIFKIAQEHDRRNSELIAKAKAAADAAAKAKEEEAKAAKSRTPASKEKK